MLNRAALNASNWIDGPAGNLQIRAKRGASRHRLSSARAVTAAQQDAIDTDICNDYPGTTDR